MSTDCEILWLEVFPYKCKRPLIVAGALYRPPSSKLQDDLKFCSNIESAYLLNLETTIMSDFNIDVLKPDHNRHKLFKFLKKLHLTQKVNQVTRPISGSCLDHLWVSHPERIATVEVKLSGLSDHLPTTTLGKYNNEAKSNKKHKTFKYRDFKSMDIQGFVQSLKEAPWDTAFILFAPIKQKRVKRKCQPAWFTSKLNKRILERNNLLKKARKSQRVEDWSLYKMSKNGVTRSIRQSKKDYFKTQVAENRNNPKKLWKLIKNLTKDGTNKHNLINLLINTNGRPHK